MNQRKDFRADETNVIEIIRALVADRYWIAGITVIVVAISLAMVMFATPVYRAQVTIVASSDGPMAGPGADLLGQFGNLAGLAGMNLSSLSGSNRVAEPYLRSNSLAQEFIKARNLEPIVNARRSSRRDWNQADKPKKGSTLWTATQYFTREIRHISTDALSGVITVSIEWNDPTVAAEWANGYVSMANERLRQRDLDDAERNIAYLNSEIGKTSAVGVQQAMFNLIEAEMKTVMLAKARTDYAFKIIDPAVPPEQRAGPRRAFIVAMSGLLGVFIGVLFASALRIGRFIREQTRSRPQSPGHGH